MLIRRTNDSDTEESHALRLRALREDPEAFGSTYEEEIDLPDERKLRRARGTEENFMLGAFDDSGHLVGMASFNRFTSIKSRHKGIVAGMYVAPEVRKQGIGKALVQELLERARRLPGLEMVLLDLNTTNVAAKALYESLGFEAYGVQKHSMKHNGVYSDEAHMVLHL